MQLKLALVLYAVAAATACGTTTRDIDRRAVLQVRIGAVHPGESES